MGAIQETTLRLILAAGLVLGTAGIAAAQADPATTIKPFVLLLLDTSGSMEYESGTASEPSVDFTEPVCEEQEATSPSQPVGSYAKSRLIVAKEVLTGTIQDYWCQYDRRDDDPDRVDFGYPIKHVKACSGDTGTGCEPPVQAFDGLLDVFRDQVKFGLMTFDSFESTDKGADGMWSYGPEGFPNLGARNDRWGIPNAPNSWDEDTGTWAFADEDRQLNNRGQLTPPSRSDEFGPVRDANRLAQYEVNTTMGFSGTPLAPILTDARWFLLNDNAVRPASGSGAGDPYAACRPRTAVLITDGRASQGEGVGGYPTTPTAIESLKDTPPAEVKVYVVGFNLADEDATMIDELDPANGGPATGVFRANTTEELREALTTIFSEVQPDIQSRTEVRFTNATHSTLDLQYQFNAAFQPDPDVPTNLRGFLDQTVFRCAAECEGLVESGSSCAVELVELHARLNERSDSSRSLLATIRGEVHGLTEGLASLPADKVEMEELFAVPQTGDLPEVDPAYFDSDGIPVPSQDIIGPATGLAHQREYLRQLISLVRADDDTMRSGEHMGAVHHTTPVVQEPAPEGRFPIRSWNEYVRTPVEGTSSSYPPRCRPTVLYAGTHDGLIHAFRVDRRQDDDPSCGSEDAPPLQGDDDVGRELWAIAPQHLLRKSHALVDGYRYLMDGKMALRDVLLSRQDPSVADLEVERLRWRSVLTAGYGTGGRGFISLDVTNALEGPDVMWEIDHRQRCHDGTCVPASDGFANDFGKMGLTTGQAAYATAFLGGQEVSVTILPGGDTPEDTANPEAGRVVYVVNTETGEKVAELSNDQGNITNLNGSSEALTSPMTGSPAVFADTPGVVSTRAFIGDAGGRMWRLDMRSDDPDEWELQLFYDPYGEDGPLEAEEDVDRQPVLGAPALALENAQGDLAVVYGTGNIDYVQLSSDSESGIFSVSEQNLANGDVAATPNWHRVFAANEQLTGEPLVFDRIAYFTTYMVDAADACAPGSGRLYGVHFSESGSGAGGEDNTLAALDADGDPTTQDTVHFVTLSDAVPFGVQIVERPACIPESAGSGAPASPGSSGAGVQRGEMQLVVNVAKGPGVGSPSTTPPDATPSTRSRTRTLSTSGETLQSSAWGYVLN
ncbi:MAG: PilC/PilY family type IV pilus protein [Myxococcota bacterium]